MIVNVLTTTLVPAHRLLGSGCSGSIQVYRGAYPTDSGKSGLQARQDRLESLPTLVDFVDVVVGAGNPIHSAHANFRLSSINA